MSLKVETVKVMEIAIKLSYVFEREKASLFTHLVIASFLQSNFFLPVSVTLIDVVPEHI